LHSDTASSLGQSHEHMKVKRSLLTTPMRMTLNQGPEEVGGIIINPAMTSK